MQSRLATTTTRSYWLFSAANNLALRRGICTADPAIHSCDPQGTKNVDVSKPATQQTETEYKPKNKGIEALVPPKPPYATSPRLESIGVNHPVEPIIQQKRRNNNNSTVTALEDVSCAGLDGWPWPRDKEKEQEQIVDYKEYYKNHKPSPLSEIEVVDSRKPIRRATDGTAYDGDVVVDVIGWRPEQLDTAEEALRRATEIFKQNAMRGDPSLPHSRVLRELRGEWF